jgi:hypothetical protein
LAKTPAVSSVTAVRPQIKSMVSPGSDEEFEKTLPTSTAAPVGDAPLGEQKRKRRTKEEMAAARGETVAPAPVVDPLMQDERYARIMADMTSGGGKEIVSFGFRFSNKPLTTKEENKLDDMFYVIAKRSKYNPAESWFAFALYFLLAVLGPMIIERTGIVAKIKALFEQEKIQPKPKTIEGEQKKESDQQSSKPLEFA